MSNAEMILAILASIAVAAGFCMWLLAPDDDVDRIIPKPVARTDHAPLWIWGLLGLAAVGWAVFMVKFAVPVG